MNTKQAASRDILPTAPGFETDDQSDFSDFATNESLDREIKETLGVKDPLVIAAEDYARACRVHMDAQSQVAKAKQTLEGAKKQEEDTYKQRVEAQSKLAEMVAKTTEAVL